jgi:hypothetical protein
MTDVVDRPAPGPRLKRSIGKGSIRTALGRLANLTQAERIRYGNLIEDGTISFSDQPVMLNGETLGDRKRQLRDWMIGGGTNRQHAEAIAGKLRHNVNYVRYMVTAAGPVLLVEYKTK